MNFLGFIANRAASNATTVWVGSNDTNRLFALPDEEVRWVDTVEALHAVLLREYPEEVPGYGRLDLGSNNIAVTDQPMFRRRGDTWAADEVETLVRLAKARGKTGVAVAGALSLPVTAGLYVPQSWYDSNVIVTWDPAKLARRKQRQLEATLTVADLDEASRELVKGLIPEELQGEFWPVRVAIFEGDRSQTLADACYRFLGRVIIMERCFGKRTVRRHATIRLLLRGWQRAAAANRAKFLQRGAVGKRFVAWCDQQVGVKKPQPAPQPVPG